MIPMRSFVVACALALAACGDKAGVQDANATWRVVAQLPTTDGEGKVAGALRDALSKHDPVAAVVALDAVGQRAAEAACASGKEAGVRVVGIGALPAAGLAANETVVVESTGASVAVELALLACQGLPLPPRVALGTRTVTAANAAAGGAARLAPGDVGIELLRRQHPDVITTTPNTDVLFAIGFVQIRGDAWHDRVRDEMQAEAKRYPQLQLKAYAANGSSERLRGLVNECLQANVRVILVATDDWDALQPAMATANERKVAVIGIDPLVRATQVTCCVGCDQEILGRAVGEQVRAQLPNGGAIVELHGDLAAGVAGLRHQGLLAALGRQAK